MSVSAVPNVLPGRGTERGPGRTVRRRRHDPPTVGDVSEVLQRQRRPKRIVQILEQREGRLERRFGGVELPAVRGDHSHRVNRSPLKLAIADRPRERESIVEELQPAVVVAEFGGQPARQEQRGRSCLGRRRPGAGQRPLGPGAAFAQLPRDVPIEAEPVDNPLGGLRLGVLHRPVEGRPDVIELDVEPGNPIPVDPDHHLRPGSLRVIAIPRRMTPARRRGLATEVELLSPEFAHRFEHDEAGELRPVVLPHQALLDEGGNTVQGIDREVAGGRGNGFDRFEREATGEDRQPPKQGLFVRRQEIVAPGDGIPHGLLPGREIAGAVDEDLQPAVQSGEQGVGREHVDAGGGQLDGKGKAVQAGADFGDRGRVLLREGEGRTGGTRLADEKGDRAEPAPTRAAGAGDRRGARPAAARETRARPAPGAPRGWWRGSSGPGRRSGGRPGRAPRRRPAPGCRARATGAARAGRPATARRAGGRPRPACPGPGRFPAGRAPDRAPRRGRRRPRRRQSGGRERGRLHGEAGLADAAGAGQGDEGDILARQQGAERVQLPVAADQRRAREGQGGGAWKGRGADHDAATPGSALAVLWRRVACAHDPS